MAFAPIYVGEYIQQQYSALNHFFFKRLIDQVCDFDYARAKKKTFEFLMENELQNFISVGFLAIFRYLLPN